MINKAEEQGLITPGKTVLVSASGLQDEHIALFLIDGS